MNNNFEKGRIPDFIVIGSMKSGSTTYFRHLTSHPQIYGSPNKELQFFSRDHNFEKGISWYKSQFSGAGENQICGEASTCYTRWPHFGNVAHRIHASAPKVKLIYIMRHPVSRAYSHYKHVMEERYNSCEKPIITFKAALHDIPEIETTSLYCLQIEQYLEYFPIEQFLFITLEELIQNRRNVLKKSFDFLGVDTGCEFRTADITENLSGTPIRKIKTNEIISRIRHASGLSQAINFIPERTRSRIRSWLVNSVLSNYVTKSHISEFQNQLSPMEEETREILLEKFSQTTKGIEILLNRKLSSWFT